MFSNNKVLFQVQCIDRYLGDVQMGTKPVVTEGSLESGSKQTRVFRDVSRPLRHREVPLQLGGKWGNFIKPAVFDEVFCPNFGKTPLKSAQKDFLPNMLHLPKFYRRNSNDELLGMARDAPWNFRTAAVPFTSCIPVPQAQTVRQVSMRTILDLLETWVTPTAPSGICRKADKNADVSALQA